MFVLVIVDTVCLILVFACNVITVAMDVQVLHQISVPVVSILMPTLTMELVLAPLVII